MTVQVPTPIDTWDDSLCQGRIREFVTQNLPTNRTERDRKARALCEGCLCMKVCAQSALDTGLTGMVSAGEALPEGGAELKVVRSRLRNFLAGRPRRMPKPQVRKPKPKPEPEPIVPEVGKPHCVRCKKTVRPRKSNPEDYPDTVALHARGLCRTCWRITSMDGTIDSYEIVKPGPDASDIPEKCRTCHVPVRPRGVPREDRPGTTAYGALGQCTTCYRKGTSSAVAS